MWKTLILVSPQRRKDAKVEGIRGRKKAHPVEDALK